MQPVQDNLGKQFQKSNGDCKIGLSCNNPRQQKGIKAACNAPGYSLTKRLVMAIVCHASWLFSLTCEMLMRLERPLHQLFSFSRLILYGCALSFYECLRIVQLSSTPPSSSSCFSPFTFPLFRSSTK